MDGTSIRHKTINKNGKKAAHDKDDCGNRFTCAQKIANKVISNYLSSSEGNVSDFLISAYDGSFYLTNITENIQAINSSFYYNNKSYFDKLNYNRTVSGNDDEDEDC